MIKPDEWTDGQWEQLDQLSETLEQLLLNPLRDSRVWRTRLGDTLKTLSLYLEEAWHQRNITNQQ